MPLDHARLLGTASPPTRDLDLIKRLLPYLWPREDFGLRARMVGCVALLVIAKLAAITLPVVYKEAVDALGPEAGIAIVPIALILAYGGLRLLQQVSTEVQDALFTRVVQRAIRRAGLEVFRHLQSLSLRFHIERQTGGLSRVIERGTRGIEVLLRLILFRTGPSALELILVCILLWGLLDWRFAALTLFTIGGYVAFTLFVTEWRLKFRRRMNEKDQEANTRAVDALLNYETVKTFTNEAHEASRFDGALRAYEDAAVKSRGSLSLLNIGQGVIVAGGMVATMLLAAYEVQAAVLTVGDFVMVNTYLLQLYLPLGFLGVVYSEVKQSLADMGAMFLLLDQPAEVADRPDAPALRASSGAIRFEDVGFAYQPERPILRGVDFTVPAGRTVAVVGPSGAGKSTLARLLLRFYDPTSGRVLVDGQDIAGVTQASLRAAIGVVPQDTVLFNDTLRYNVAYGRIGASQEEIDGAVRDASLDAFVASLPDGLETRVGERGLKLSGGEKQRVAIARALLKDPPILILDEATSSLDTHTERAIQGALRRAAAGRTTLVIAHRLSTIIDADEILVLDGGRIVERGSHERLLAIDGLYAALWRQQLEAQRKAGESELAEAAALLGESESDGLVHGAVQGSTAPARAEAGPRAPGRGGGA